MQAKVAYVNSLLRWFRPTWPYIALNVVVYTATAFFYSTVAWHASNVEKVLATQSRIQATSAVLTFRVPILCVIILAMAINVFLLVRSSVPHCAALSSDNIFSTCCLIVFSNHSHCVPKSCTRLLLLLLLLLQGNLLFAIFKRLGTWDKLKLRPPLNCSTYARAMNRILTECKAGFQVNMKCQRG